MEGYDMTIKVRQWRMLTKEQRLVLLYGLAMLQQQRRSIG
jgi:hypothetical protein